eukprot:63863-Rhodomonas_salina.2
MPTRTRGVGSRWRASCGLRRTCSARASISLVSSTIFCSRRPSPAPPPHHTPQRQRPRRVTSFSAVPDGVCDGHGLEGSRLAVPVWSSSSMIMMYVSSITRISCSAW